MSFVLESKMAHDPELEELEPLEKKTSLRLIYESFTTLRVG